MTLRRRRAVRAAAQARLAAGPGGQRGFASPELPQWRASSAILSAARTGASTAAVPRHQERRTLPRSPSRSEWHAARRARAAHRPARAQARRARRRAPPRSPATRCRSRPGRWRPSWQRSRRSSARPPPPPCPWPRPSRSRPDTDQVAPHRSSRHVQTGAGLTFWRRVLTAAKQAGVQTGRGDDQENCPAAAPARARCCPPAHSDGSARALTSTYV